VKKVFEISKSELQSGNMYEVSKWLRESIIQEPEAPYYEKFFVIIEILDN
jgi:hypothetical protein